jgi:hypothetical protein
MLDGDQTKCVEFFVGIQRPAPPITVVLFKKWITPWDELAISPSDRIPAISVACGRALWMEASSAG